MHACVNAINNKINYEKKKNEKKKNSNSNKKR